MYKLKIIIGSTRPGRKGPSIASWIMKVAEQHPEFEAELIDLAVVNLPFFDEPGFPAMQKYEHQHTKDWSAKINPADAFIFVIPEYNNSYTAPVKNALDFLFKEWNYKPVAFVSYGGIAAGTKAVQALKPVVSAQKMVPLVEAITIPFFNKYIDTTGTFIPDDGLTKSADGMFAELVKWAKGLKAMRG